jgi:hypothetical protein
MSRLSIFSPTVDESPQPVVLPFPSVVEPRPSAKPTRTLPSHRHRTSEMGPCGASTLHRARALAKNRTCRFCRHPQVEPIELADPQLGRGNLPIPGTASLVGFRCHSCRSEWPH